MMKDEIPAEYLCPLSRQIMLDPVLAGDGENYEREEIEKYLATSKQKNGKWMSPVHQTEMENQVLPNRPMKNIIEKFLSKHPHLKKEDMYFSEALAAVDSEQVKQKIKATTPEKRPPNATWDWIANWLMGAKTGKWWWPKKVGYMLTIATAEDIEWAEERPLIEQWKTDIEDNIANRLLWEKRWTIRVGRRNWLCYPLPEKHDEYVKTLTEQLEALEKYCLDKIAQAKKGIRLTN